MIETEDRAAVSAVVSGKVQGVGFRDFARREAFRFRLTGWVRNQSDGKRVEIHAEGTCEELERFIDVIGRGPAGSRVDQVDWQWTAPQGHQETFDIRR